MKCYSGFNFQNQEYIESPKEKSVVTYLKHMEGFILKHTLTHSDKSGFAFYRKLSNVIRCGKTTVCGSRGKSVRHPEGVQIVVRKTDDEILVIYHGFKKSDGEFEIDIPSGYVVSDSFYADSAELTDGKLLIKDVKEYTAGALLLKK